MVKTGHKILALILEKFLVHLGVVIPNHKSMWDLRVPTFESINYFYFILVSIMLKVSNNLLRSLLSDKVILNLLCEFSFYATLESCRLNQNATLM